MHTSRRLKLRTFGRPIINRVGAATSSRSATTPTELTTGNNSAPNAASIWNEAPLNTTAVRAV